jgi:hypothetical protein
MVGDDRKIKTNPAPKNDALPKNKRTPDAAPSKAEGGEKAAHLSSGSNRGEGQKPVSKAYKENWNLIFAKKESHIPPLSRCARFGPSTQVTDVRVGTACAALSLGRSCIRSCSCSLAEHRFLERV